jgi:hypothetical protein
MSFASQGQAKRFFVERIVAQAKREGLPLSSDEEWMLSFSESDTEFAVEVGRVNALEAVIPESDYEAKIAGLAHRACETDLATSPSMLADYKEAFRALNRGDHYLLIMLKQGLGRWLRPWWAFWR